MALTNSAEPLPYPKQRAFLHWFSDQYRDLRCYVLGVGECNAMVEIGGKDFVIQKSDLSYASWLIVKQNPCKWVDLRIKRTA